MSDQHFDDALDLDAALSQVPIFPLSHVVLFPRALLPLHIFEPRYRAMLRDSLASAAPRGLAGAIAMALIVDPADLDACGNPRICPVAGLGAIVEHEPLADGRSNILLQGQARVLLDELPYVPPYRRARATILHEIATPVTPADRAALFGTASAFVGELAKRDPKFSFNLPRDLNPGAVADMCAHHLIVDAAVRQDLLCELDVAERVRKVIVELAQQRSALARESGTGVVH